MGRLYVYSLFDKKTNRPRCTGLRIGNKTIHKELFRPGSRKPLYEINLTKKSIRDIILQAVERGAEVVISDFKSHLKHFELPLSRTPYEAYDLHLPDLSPTDSIERDHKLLDQVLEAMQQAVIKPYHKVIANAAVVYESFEQTGLWLGYTQIHPKWSMKTFSGRSKALGFPVQGAIEGMLRGVGRRDDDVLIHFDWISADIRVAAILSGDERLMRAFDASDPYTAMMYEINANSTSGQLSRSEAKTYLLESINSMNVDSDALLGVYPKLGRWVAKCRMALAGDAGYLDTVLGRRFRLQQARNKLAVLNGVMQGSVAHGMQLTIRRLWELLGDRLLLEIHDSLVVTSSAEPAAVRATINSVVPIMMYPFNGLLDDNPCFPLKVSIGKHWRQWRWFETHRKDAVERFNGQKATPTTSPAA